MNSWEVRKLAIVESDDTEDRYDRNGLNFLFYWKAKYPKFKISLFTIPNRTSKEMITLLSKHDWIELLVHGFNHSSNFECFGWDEEIVKTLIGPLESKGYGQIFKAPGWTITPDLCGYPANENDPIVKDKQAVYKGLKSLDYVVCDRHYNKPRRVEGGKYICIDDNPDIVHMHTWDMGGNPNERNGYRQVIEEQGEPWDHDTEFKFMTEAWEEGLFNECKD